MVAVLALALALAMDATAVAAARGMATAHVPGREAVLVPALFGGFQAGMSALGWLGGRWLGPVIEKWDHWIAFGLLSALGLRMIIGALGKKDPGADAAVATDVDAPPPPSSNLMQLIGLAIATSIDALAAGITLPTFDAPPAVALVLIGVVTAALSAAGLYAGRRLGARLGRRLEALGGVVLIGIGINALL